MFGLKPDYRSMEVELHRFLDPVFSDIEIEVGFSDWWRRTQVVFRWAGFSDLLPDERFRKVSQAIPPGYSAMKLNGAAWIELAPGETIEEFARLPRADDAAGDEPRIARLLESIDFFAALRRVLGATPSEACSDELAASRRILRAKGLSAEDARTACLVFIRHGAYCDCEVLRSAAPKLLAGELSAA